MPDTRTLQVLPAQAAYEAFQTVRYLGQRRIPWRHPAIAKARPAWKAASDAAIDASGLRPLVADMLSHLEAAGISVDDEVLASWRERAETRT